MEIDALNDRLNKKKLDNCYILFGIDELLIKEQVKHIINTALTEDFRDLNLIRLDGMKLNTEDFRNACETVPFFSDKKVVLVYRANFLRDKIDNDNKSRYSFCEEYIKAVPSYCVLIFYYIFDDKREKPSKKLKSLDKYCLQVKADKLKGDKLYKRVNSMFLEEGKEINKVELKYFCDNVENNMQIIKNEVDKLVSYTEGRDIKKKDIEDMLPYKSEDDIFDLVDFISQKRPEKAIELLNQLIYKGENILLILSMIERQFKLLFNIKLALSENKNKEQIAKELKLHVFVCEKLIAQGRKFGIKQIKKCLELCGDTEKLLKSTSIDKKMELELMIIRTVLA